jgi:polar amino acid transport system substrate-binding protein
LAALAVGAAARGRGPHPAEPQPPKRETNLARILRTKKLRLAGLIDEEPYFGKDLATRRWNGFCVNMGEDLAAELGTELQIIESNWTDSLVDLQTNKFDLCWVSPTVERALVVDLSTPLFHDTFAIVARKEFAPKSWAELNQPQSRIAVDIGSRHQQIVRRVAEDATITGFKTRDEAILAVESGRADCIVSTVLFAVTALKRKPQLGALVVPMPAVQAPVCAALPYDDDHRFRDVINAWGEDNRDSGRMREWIMASLSGLGIGSADLPPGVSF